jgi:hypothetical protein
MRLADLNRQASRRHLKHNRAEMRRPEPPEEMKVAELVAFGLDHFTHFACHARLSTQF